ncbi:Photosystem I P700 chlorophyll a apoprotein [Arachis hypogaea]|nr:Photosystem I P700 chlorophyll a apoprotein [Arachis hypogaea]
MIPFLVRATSGARAVGVLFARSSRLIPDKANLGFRFPCDGPGRGGTCQVSAWDHVFLGLFWIGVVPLPLMGGSAISYGRKPPSGRGYWQELIESIVWAHNKLKVAPATQPRALSIVQGRAVGVTHYLLGGIATTWTFFLARIIAVG